MGEKSTNARRVSDLKSEAEVALEKGDASRAYHAIIKAMSISGYNRATDLLALQRRAGFSGKISGFSDGWHARTSSIASSAYLII